MKEWEGRKEERRGEERKWATSTSFPGSFPILEIYIMNDLENTYFFFKEPHIVRGDWECILENSGFYSLASRHASLRARCIEVVWDCQSQEPDTVAQCLFLPSTTFQVLARLKNQSTEIKSFSTLRLCDGDTHHYVLWRCSRELEGDVFHISGFLNLSTIGILC